MKAIKYNLSHKLYKIVGNKAFADVSLFWVNMSMKISSQQAELTLLIF